MVGNFIAGHKSQIIFNFLNQKTIWGFLSGRRRQEFHVWLMGLRPGAWVRFFDVKAHRENG